MHRGKDYFRPHSVPQKLLVIRRSAGRIASPFLLGNNCERLCAPECMTGETRSIRQISGNFEKFQAGGAESLKYLTVCLQSHDEHADVSTVKQLLTAPKKRSRSCALAHLCGLVAKVGA
jgi:hypothetical protein